MAFLFTFGNFLFRGFVIMLVWSMIISEIFTLGTISYPEALGLSVVIAFFKGGKSFSDIRGKNDDDLIMDSIGSLVMHAFILLIAFIIGLFI